MIPEVSSAGAGAKSGLQQAQWAYDEVAYGADVGALPQAAQLEQATLDYEREEEALFRAVSGQDVAFDSCDLGTFLELKERVS